MGPEVACINTEYLGLLRTGGFSRCDYRAAKTKLTVFRWFIPVVCDYSISIDKLCKSKHSVLTYPPYQLWYWVDDILFFRWRQFYWGGDCVTELIKGLYWRDVDVLWRWQQCVTEAERALTLKNLPFLLFYSIQYSSGVFPDDETKPFFFEIFGVLRKKI